MCAEAGMTCEWTGPTGCAIRQVSPRSSTITRARARSCSSTRCSCTTSTCLDPETRDSLRTLFAEEDMPRNVYFGDGTPIPDETMETIGELYEELCVEFPWEAGDLIAVDNMLVAARSPAVPASARSSSRWRRCRASTSSTRAVGGAA